MSSLPEFLQPLEFLVRPFPRDAVEAAISRRVESTPHLLHALQWADENPDAANHAHPPYLLHLYAFFLLAQFREARACPLILRLARNPAFEALTGDIATENLHQILASVCDGNTAPIEELIEDPAVDEWVRGAAVRSFGVLLHTGRKSRDTVSTYFGQLFAGRLLSEPNHAWDALIEVCTDFGMREHLDEIRRLFREEIADPWIDDLDDLEREIALPPGTSTRVRWDRYALIDDTISEMGSWHCFSENAAQEDEEADFDDLADMEDALADVFPAAPVVRAAPKIGRNDQCPCGSGKKYKKCCGQFREKVA
ncbi:MAG TPA: DUF1186 domain-containing protein [Blastocatellia bacterium]|nr:DUF1186 domain-containing protein [Blastocatellia bacterium]